MSRILLTYATTNNHYFYYQQNNIKEFLRYGEFDTIYSCNETNIQPDYYQKFKHIFQSEHGGVGGRRAGFWLWKPYLISRALARANDGDIIFYADATIVQKSSLEPIFRLLDKQSMIPFIIGDGLGDEREVCKRDAFVLMGCDEEKYWTGKVPGQHLASYIFLKKDEFTTNFVNEWHTYAEDERILTELPNTQGLPDYDMFKFHRHDQSIYSLLIKKYNIEAYHDITQYGNGTRLTHETWGQLLVHQR